jgi:hypothetical protein
LAGFKSGHEPYLFQSQAAQIAINHGALLLGDDVGLGKTISALAMLCMGAPLPAAVVVQPHIAGQWAARISEFTTLRSHVIKSTQPYSLPEADVYIFGYSKVAGWVPVLKDGLCRTVVFDEIQELRHGKETGKGRACGILTDNADLKLGLSATPIYNYGNEIWNVLEFIRPELLGNRGEFLREWCGRDWKKVNDPDALGSYLHESGFMLRRREDDAIVDQALPPLNVLEHEIGFDHVRADEEQALTRTLAMAVLRGSFVEAGKAARELDARMRLLTGVGKARSVAAYVKMLLRGGTERVLLAGWHREVYEIWQRELTEFEPVLYTGSESPAGKQRSFDAFTKGDSRVMLISLRSGIGLDGLQHHCRDIVYGELDWSPQVHHQIAGRLRRPGQTGQVTAHYLHVAEGSDPVLIETLGVKSDQQRGISDPGLAPRQRFSDDSRIKRLAQHVLGLEATEVAA